MNLWEIFFTMELFFAALALGLIVGLVTSYFFSFFSLKMGYELELKWAKQKKNVEEIKKFEFFNKEIAVAFWGYFVILLLLIGVLVYSFISFADLSNKVKSENIDANTSGCVENTAIINNYNFTVNQIISRNTHQELSIKELQYSMKRKYAF